MPKLWLAGAILLALGAYALTPALALLRLDRAMADGDAAGIARMVDFPAVRKGLAQEVAEGMPAAPAPIRPAADTLPPFGFSFASGIADHAITHRLTPGRLIGLTRSHAAPGVPPARMRLAGVWIEGPTRMGVRLHMTGERQPIRLWMQFEHGRWMLARIWLPPALLRRAAGNGADRADSGTESADAGPDAAALVAPAAALVPAR
jgi:hypothetical protein